LTAISGEISLINQIQKTAEPLDDDTVILNDFKQLKSKTEQHIKEITNSSMAFDSATGLLVAENSSKLLDHNDKDVLYHWDPPAEQDQARKQYDLVLDEQKNLLRLRSCVVRFVDTCLDRWLEADNDINTLKLSHETLDNRLASFKNALISFDYGPSSDLSDDSQEDAFDANLKIYITKSNYLKRWPQLGLDKVLNVFVSLSSDLCQSQNAFLQAEQQNQQPNLKACRDSLKEHFASLKKRFDSLLNNFEVNNSNFKIELVSKCLECFSSSLECFSFVLTIFTLCLSSTQIKPIWNEKIKKSKKKKTLYLQFAASIDIVSEIYEMLCQMLSYFVGQLKQRLCENIVTLTEVKCSSISPTIMRDQQNVANHLSDVAPSYLKSFNELRNFFNAKLKYLLKFSGSINIQLDLENLKVN
jgi:uncharacterized membrane-anchored protein YhcB (DUF1043 family)